MISSLNKHSELKGNDNLRRYTYHLTFYCSYQQILI